MDNYSAFESEKKTILNAFENADSWQEGKARTEAYKKYTEQSNTVFSYSTDCNWMLYVGIGVLVMAFLVFLMMKGRSKPLEYIFMGIGLILCLISLAAGPVGLIICFVAIGIIVYLVEKFTMVIFIILLVAALILIGWYLYDRSSERKTFESGKSRKMKEAGEEFCEHDRLFKLELVRAMGNLCAKYKANDSEYDAAMNELFEEFKKPHVYEISKYLFTDVSKLSQPRPVKAPATGLPDWDGSSKPKKSAPSLMFDSHGFLKMGDCSEDGYQSEPIQWIKLQENADSILVISRFALAYGKATDAEEILNKIRTAYFLPSERNLISRIFLLSAEEAEKYMDEDDRRCQSIPDVYDESQMNAEIRMRDSSESCWWWLSDNAEGKQAYVDCKGNVHSAEDGIEEDFEYFTIRPAMLVKKA